MEMAMGVNSGSSLEDRPVALVTGGARRVGAALCRALSASGYRVVIHCNRSHAEARGLQDELGGAEYAAVLAADLAKGGVGRLACSAEKVFGRLDGIVNNASTYRRKSLLAISDSELREDLEVNFLAPFQVMREFARRGKPGWIVNLLDGRIAKDDVECAGYLLAKKSLAEATRLCALDWAPLGIRVNAVAPGFVLPVEGASEDALARLVERLPLRRRTPVEELAQAVLFLANTSSVTGTILYLDSGMHLQKTDTGEKSTRL